MTRLRLRWLMGACLIYGGVGLLMLFVVSAVVICTVLLVMEIHGDDAWPSGLFLALLVLYCLRVLWRYSSQQAEDRRRARDEEDSRLEYYS